MPKQIVAKVSWTIKKPTQMASFAKETASDMTGNATFPSPPVIPKDMEDAANKVTSTYAKRNEGPVAKTTFENALNDLDEKLHDQADYVSFTAKGDAIKIESAGFIPTSNSRNSAVRPETPHAAKLTAEGGQRMKSVVDKVMGATEYSHIFYTDPNSKIVVDQYHITLSSNAGGSFIVATGGLTEEASGLTALTNVYVTVVAHNAAGNSNAGPVVSSGVI